ncbi:hypothetical protein EJ08DRAFT_650757 [Tothia fuscella]|uniref:Uncharacterized protein n=1 Tax=Tothia fuscella TaxID=1048955 RepID=A0A9P4NNX9_9PEZI|nr:hypothetical protein EJ08DRAFT_650757 [Tothia fuscella]
MATGGLVKMSKREFYGLFRRAFESAFTEKNILSAWMQAGLQLFDPQVVLTRISPTNQRPSTGTSKSSGSSILNP